jgi:hypothetical protein
VSIAVRAMPSGSAGSGWAVRLNYGLNSDIFTVAVSAGSAGLVMDQVQFSRISGAASATSGTAMLITNGYTFANTIQAIDIEVVQSGLKINSPYENRNTFVSPYFTDSRYRRLQQPAAQFQLPRIGAAEHGELDRDQELPCEAHSLVVAACTELPVGEPRARSGHCDDADIGPFEASKLGIPLSHLIAALWQTAHRRQGERS